MAFRRFSYAGHAAGHPTRAQGLWPPPVVNAGGQRTIRGCLRLRGGSTPMRSQSSTAATHDERITYSLTRLSAMFFASFFHATRYLRKISRYRQARQGISGEMFVKALPVVLLYLKIPPFHRVLQAFSACRGLLFPLFSAVRASFFFLSLRMSGLPPLPESFLHIQ